MPSKDKPSITQKEHHKRWHVNIGPLEISGLREPKPLPSWVYILVLSLFVITLMVVVYV